MHDQFSKERIRPGEPSAGEVSCVVLEVALVNEPTARRPDLQHSQRFANLACRNACERIHHLRHWPDHARAFVRATDAFARTATKKPRVALTPYEGSGACIQSRIRR